MSFIRIYRIFCLSLFFLIIVPTTIFAVDEVTVESKTLNVRDGEGTEFNTIGTIYKDESYEIIQETDDWFEINWEEQTGWISKEYVHTSSEPDESDEKINQTAANKEALETFTTEIHHMYVREKPSTTSPITSYFDKGTTCTVLDEDADKWLYVECDDTDGYMLRDHVAFTPILENESLHGKTIVIDAGHGGRDVGSISISGSYEKDLTLKTSLALEEALTSLGAQVHMTRDDDSYALLESRSIYANTLRADAFISLHYNSFPEVPTVTGIGTYYYEGLDQFLAESLQNSVSMYSESKDRGIEFGDYQVLRLSVRPSALIELGFISNEDSEKLLQTDAYQDKLVHGIVNGLSAFFSDQIN